MKKLNIYIAKQIFVGFLLVTFSLISILWLTKSLSFIEMITNKGLPVSLFLKITSLLMPRFFTILSPIALFVSTLFVYNRMLSDRELVVMKAAGITPWQGAKPAIFMGLALSLFCLYVNNIVTPAAEQEFDDLEWQIKNDISHLMFREGVFTTLQPGLTIFISSHEKDGSAKGILINDERNPKNRVTVSAERGIVTYTEKGPRIVMENGIRQEIGNIDNQFSSLSFDRYSVDFGVSGNNKKRKDTSRTKTLSELLGARDNTNLDEKDINRYILEGNKRLMSPFYNLTFALLGCTGLLVGAFNRRGQTKIITLSIIAMVVIQAGDLAFSNLCNKNLYFMILLYNNLLSPILLCLFLLKFYNPAWLHRLTKSSRTAKI